MKQIRLREMDDFAKLVGKTIYLFVPKRDWGYLVKVIVYNKIHKTVKYSYKKLDRLENLNLPYNVDGSMSGKVTGSFLDNVFIIEDEDMLDLKAELFAKEL